MNTSAGTPPVSSGAASTPTQGPSSAVVGTTFVSTDASGSTTLVTGSTTVPASQVTGGRTLCVPFRSCTFLKLKESGY